MESSNVPPDIFLTIVKKKGFLMTKWIFSLILCLTLSLVSAPSLAEDFVLEPASVVGFGTSKRAAKDEARELLDEALTDIENSLPEGDEVIDVVTVYEWDGVAFEITFEAVIHRDDP